MKGLWILAGLAAAGVVLVLVLLKSSSADVDRKYETATKERATIELLLRDCSTLVHEVSEQKHAELKKTELQELRQKFETLGKQADDAKSDEKTPREERKKKLEKLADDFYNLRRSAEDLRVRLTQVKEFDEKLRPEVARLGRLTKALSDAQVNSLDPEFQQRALGLIQDGRKWEKMAEGGLRTMSKSYKEGHPVAESGLKALQDVLTSMEQLLAHQAPPKNAPKSESSTAAGH